MTGETTGPNAGIASGWTPGSDGWNAGMDRNLAALDALLFLTVLDSALTAPPVAPASGDRYIVAPAATAAWAGKDKMLAVSIGGAWVFYTPKMGWTATSIATGTHYYFDGTNWAVEAHPYEIQAYAAKLPAAGTPVFSVLFRQKVTFPVGLAGSAVAAKVAATAAASLPLKRNGVAVGSLDFAAAGTAATLTFAAAVAFVVGDVLDCLAPATADATLAQVGIALLGTR